MRRPTTLLGLHSEDKAPKLLAKTQCYKLNRRRQDQLNEKVSSVYGYECVARTRNVDKSDELRGALWIEVPKADPNAEKCDQCQGRGRCVCPQCEGEFLLFLSLSLSLHLTSVLFFFFSLLLSGLGRTNYTSVSMLPSGEYPVWCNHCGGSGKSFCTKCHGLGSKMFQHSIGFRLPHNITSKE